MIGGLLRNARVQEEQILLENKMMIRTQMERVLKKLTKTHLINKYQVYLMLLRIDPSLRDRKR